MKTFKIVADGSAPPLSVIMPGILSATLTAADAAAEA